MQVQTIVVPTDFSEFADHALTWALGMAADWKAKVVAVHAVHPISYLALSESVYVPDLQKMEAEMMADAEKRLADFIAKKGPSPVVVETRVVMGEPMWEICQSAIREHADLIRLVIPLDDQGRAIEHGRHVARE